MEHNSDFTHDLKFGQKGESVVAEILEIFKYILVLWNTILHISALSLVLCL